MLKCEAHSPFSASLGTTPHLAGEAREATYMAAVHIDAQSLMKPTLRGRKRNTPKAAAQVLRKHSDMVLLLNAEGEKVMSSVRLHCDMRKRSFALSDRLSTSRRRLLAACKNSIGEVVLRSHEQGEVGAKPHRQPGPGSRVHG
jgi:hypothetical protein